jgi:DNA-binding NtrC family response regulator
MSEKILFAWVGTADMKASRGELDGQLGPTCQAAVSLKLPYLRLLFNQDDKAAVTYEKWVKKRTKANVKVFRCPLEKPTNLGEIYEAATRVLKTVSDEFSVKGCHRYFHLSPGTPQMAIVWMILGNSLFPAEFLESSREHGANILPCPFELSVNYLPNISKGQKDDILALSQGLPPEAPEFEEIIHRSRQIKSLITTARRLAILDFPVLITGESGTGKELFARAIHKSSTRANNRMIAVNCGAIPEELFEAEFFGHTKGAFTGADKARTGYLVEANQGVLFLDEIGELSMKNQVKFLRALQEKKCTPVGSTVEKQFDTRIIAATNRDLLVEAAGGKFRTDLFHRLAIGVIHLPALRERPEDLGPLTAHFLERINRECEKLPGWKHKKISAEAKKVIAAHSWPGNIRELVNTLTRAAILTPTAEVSEEHMRTAIFRSPGMTGTEPEILNRPFGEGFSLPHLIEEVARHYLKRALEEAHGNKTKATHLVGLSNYQTLTNWLEKYQVD